MLNPGDKGKQEVILYFYPKDDTPGCTQEACGFRDAVRTFEGKNAVILGVSNDDTSSHEKFARKYNLPFSLLSDTDKKVAEAYGVYKEKNLYGRKYMGIERTTFIIGKDGKIKKIFPQVKVEGHSEEILKALESL